MLQLSISGFTLPRSQATHGTCMLKLLMPESGLSSTNQTAQQLLQYVVCQFFCLQLLYSIVSAGHVQGLACQAGDVQGKLP